jgi:hypothetical protein
MVDINMSED